MVTPWVFDDNVAERFVNEAEGHIPNYYQVIDKCKSIANLTMKPDAVIVDIGSAVGTTLKIFGQAGFTNLYGVESSDSMIRKAKECVPTVTFIKSSNFPHTKLGKCDLIMANWTLHFMTEEVRKAYIKDIHTALQPNGIFVLTEKVAHSALSLALYHDFKSKNGISKEAIIKKQKSLEGVLIPLPMSWYMDTLSELFDSIEIIDASFCFITILAKQVKRKIGSEDA